MDFEVVVLPPAYEFINGLPEKMRAKVYRGIELLKLFGYRLGEPHAKTLKNTEGLKELRIKLATDICRIFYFHYKERLYVAASGYIKKADKTDEQEIQRALRIRNDFCKEHGL
ncbi:MAG TPA: type II toxin-antitoxin system RelE/ParE family toxin [Chitinivibrionales bacterium]|jgi:phage-related protein|nr:type II toxin-antitoxin system RelE/ParE family toxin [Chitinivibrionales bacterium]